MCLKSKTLSAINSHEEEELVGRETFWLTQKIVGTKNEK